MSSDSSVNLQIISYALSIGGALLGAIGGYISRKAQKLENVRDEVHIKILPSLNFIVISFLESIKQFQSDGNTPLLINRLDEILKDLKAKIVTGEVMIARIDLIKLQAFHWDLAHFREWLEGIKGVEDLENRLKEQFEAQETDVVGFEDVNPEKLKNDAKAISQEIDNKILSYRSYSRYLVIIILLAAAVIATGIFLGQLASSSSAGTISTNETGSQ